ncbi:MAG: EAL domain-containing protein [Eubacteriales bacterium]|nr:EAL domain-containing protein [Eubacteriales bacterium]
MICGNTVKDDFSRKDISKASDLNSKRILMRATILTMFIVMLSALYLIYEWNRYQSEASAEAIALAQSLKVLLPEEYIINISESAEYSGTLEYNTIRDNLSELVETTKFINRAYFLAEYDGNISILMDSAPTSSPEFYSPEQVDEKLNNIYLEPFRSGETVITKPIKNNMGTWISVLVPIFNTTNNEIQAVFGIDYFASEWYSHLWGHMFLNIIIAICIIILSFLLLSGWIQYKTNRDLSIKLFYSEVLYRNIFEQAPIGIAIVNGENFTYKSDYGHNHINPMFEKIMGRSSEELMNLKWTDITHPDDLHANVGKYEDFKNGVIDGYSMEKRYIKPDGSVVWANIKVSQLLGFDNTNSMHLTVVEDISERKQTELSLKENKRQMEVLLSHLPGMAYRCNYDHDWTMQFVSEGGYSLTGYAPRSLLYNRELSFNDLISPEYRDVLWKKWEDAVSKKLPFKSEYEIITKNGECKWVIEMGQGIYNEHGEVDGLEGIILDITDRKEMENNLRFINEHDRSTGLYNRDYLERVIVNDAKKSEMQKRAVISINLSTVQLLTSNYGFHYTQNLIINASEALSRHCSDTCMLFKAYENRFVFYLTEYKDREELIDFSEKISKTLEEVFVTDRIGGGIGILEFDKDKELDVDLLLKRLLIASERATKFNNKDFSYCFYNQELEELVNRERDIRKSLSGIISGDDSDELYLQYQPIFDLETDTVCGFEALARLRTEKLGLVSPCEFIPIAEKTKLIIPLGEEIIVQALSFLNRVNDNGFDTINISINISVVQLLSPEFASRLLEIIGEMQTNPKNVCIEITESIFSMDYEDINSIIYKLRDAGIQIAIDDFGTGYSSLAREKELSVNYVKIDKNFIDKLIDVDCDKEIASDIISMAHKLGHFAIAEGVESEVQKQYLLDHGCDKIQGYLIAKPLDEEAVIELLKNQTK